MGFHCSIQVPEPAVTQGISDRIWQTQTFCSLKLKKRSQRGQNGWPFLRTTFCKFDCFTIRLSHPKQQGEFRMIHHLSYPKGGSINDFIDPKLSSVQYTSFDAAIVFIQKLGRNCKLFKIDLKMLSEIYQFILLIFTY